MTPCPKCGGQVWEGPRYTAYNGLTSTWPRYSRAEGGAAHSEALEYRCATCQYHIYQPTVEKRKDLPVPAPVPALSDMCATCSNDYGKHFGTRCSLEVGDYRTWRKRQ